jgi:hypothetical protein
MLILSILIVCALASAVVSFFVAGGTWLLCVTVVLVMLAFYLSRRTSRIAAQSAADGESDIGPAARAPRTHLRVIVDERMFLRSGRHRTPAELSADEESGARGVGPAGELAPRIQNGQSVAG